MTKVLKHLSRVAGAILDTDLVLGLQAVDQEDLGPLATSHCSTEITDEPQKPWITHRAQRANQRLKPLINPQIRNQK